MLNRQGWSALVLALAGFVVGRVFGLIELYVLGAGLLFAVLISIVQVQRPLPAMKVRRLVTPSLVGVGEPARVDLEVANAGTQRSPYLQLWEPVGSSGGAPMQLASLAPGEASTAAYRVPTQRRGLITIGPLRARRRDVLGLAQRIAPLAGTDNVLVVPLVVPLPFPRAGAAGRLGQHLRMKAWGQTGTEFHSLRDYVAGDDIRRINWKASARSDDLVVRETAMEGIRRCTVVLDCHRQQYTADSFEHAVIAAASVVASAAHGTIATRFVGDHLDLRGPDVLPNALRALATVQMADEPTDVSALSAGLGEGIGLVVVITGSEAAGFTERVRSVLGHDETLITVCATSSSASRRFTVDGTSAAALLASWTALSVGHAEALVS